MTTNNTQRDLVYVAIDGDDIGRKLTACYILNDDEGLRKTCEAVTSTVAQFARLLEEDGFTLFFSAADGIAARTAEKFDANELHAKLRAVAAPAGLTFSMGVGNSLREAYMALMLAKSTGKDRVVAVPLPAFASRG